MYERAGARFDIDWSFLASIGAQECGNGECAGTNEAGCAGPMQIAYVRGSACSPGSGPTLWERYAVNADPGHPLSINDPADAIFTAARILREDMGAPPSGGTFAEYHEAACHYYGACGDSTVAYAEEVMARAVQYGFTGSGAPLASSPPLARTSQRRLRSGLRRLDAGQQLADRQDRRKPDRPRRTPSRDQLHDLRAVRGVVRALRELGLEARRRSAARLDSRLRLLRLAVQLGPGTRRESAPAEATPAPGDAVFYGSGPTKACMSAIVQRVFPDGRITAIEGNDANHVTLVGPFLPADATSAGEAAPIYGYAQPPASTAPKERGPDDTAQVLSTVRESAGARPVRETTPMPPRGRQRPPKAAAAPARANRPGKILDLFAGAGGWAEGLRMLGLTAIGIETDDGRVATAPPRVTSICKPT